MANKTLVAFYSWGGNTKKIAEHIAAYTGADLFEITPAAPYPSDYDAVVAQAKVEIQSSLKPPMGKSISLDEYDTIFVGTPNWWSTIAPPVATFLSGSDFAGKTLVPFCTHGGGGTARCFRDTAKYSKTATVLEGLSLYDDGGEDAAQNVQNWLRELGGAK